ncbi:hypothetical protein ACNOYE_30880 [Nannocystaceae bacterium ST9]
MKEEYDLLTNRRGAPSSGMNKREARLRAMMLFSIKLRVEWLYWQQRRMPPTRLPRVSKREAREISSVPVDDIEAWQQLLEVELRSLARQHGVVSIPKVTISAAVPNAASDGQRVHLNPIWARHITASICGHDGACKQALMRGIAAHEFAHHLRGEDVTDRHEEELRADAWAARSLTQYGIDLQPYLELVGEGPELDSATHPSAPRRRRAVENAALTEPLQGCTAGCTACASDDSQLVTGCVCSSEVEGSNST